MPLDIAIVEDDTRVRRTLVRILEEAEGCRACGEYATAEEALARLPQCVPDVVLMDIDLPEMSGVECVRRLVEKLPKVRILMLTVFHDADTIFDALSAGAVGYLVKPIRAAQLVEAIHDAYDGGAPMTSSVARKVVQLFRRTRPSAPEASALSPREQQVLDHLAQGYLYKEIADRLGISYATLRTHVERIYHKLHVRSRAQAVARYLRRGAP
ncbi:MAG: response regulator transcription factor [Verrucomicrobiae bacterium]|nr:response regulator transcription factor [Verrucomicrobiae bacterium]